MITSDDGKYEILGTMTDQFDRAKAKANAEDVLLRHPDVAAMVGLFEYNPPLILEALERAGRLVRIQAAAQRHFRHFRRRRLSQRHPL